MKDQALFSSKDKSKKLNCCLLQFVFGALRVKFYSVFVWALTMRNRHPVASVNGNISDQPANSCSLTILLIKLHGRVGCAGYPDRFCHQGKQTGSHKDCIPLKKW